MAPVRPAATALVLAALWACAGDSDATRAADQRRTGGTVVVATAEDIDAANPLVSQLGVPRDFLRNALFLPLVRYGPDLEIEPALAAEWTMTGDTGVVFRLRHDVRWHDGASTTAMDAKFTFDRATDPATAYGGAGELTFFTRAEVVDSFTIRFAWRPHSDPLAAFPFLPLVPEHLLDTVPPAATANAEFNHAPVGNGPFRFVAYRPNERWEFEANPDYPAELGGRPPVDRLVLRVIPDASARIAELRTGGADLILNPGADAWAGLAADPGLQGIVRPARNYSMIVWNGRRTPLGDAVVRRALMVAIDRQRMVDALRGGIGTLAVGPIGPYHWAFADSLKPLPFDTAQARSLLESAGITDRTGDGTLDLTDGRPFSFTVNYPADQQLMRDIAEVVENDLGQIGVNVRLEPVEFNTLVGRLTSPTRSFDAVIMGWESDFRVNLRDLFHSAMLSGPYQIAGYANPRVDALIDSIAVIVGRDEARPLYHRLQRILRDEQPWGFLYYFPDLNIARNRLRNVTMDVRGSFVNVDRWWVSDAAAPEAR